MAPEPHQIRLKRLAMRSMRRGIKEMDVILSAYADARLPAMHAADLDLVVRTEVGEAGALDHHDGATLEAASRWGDASD